MSHRGNDAEVYAQGDAYASPPPPHLQNYEIAITLVSQAETESAIQLTTRTGRQVFVFI
jgi:hypothetical protein